MNLISTLLNVEQLEKLNTKRLLAYQKKKRKYLYTNKCDCGCEDYMWNIVSGYEKEEKEHKILQDNLDEVKRILKTREHVD